MNGRKRQRRRTDVALALLFSTLTYTGALRADDRGADLVAIARAGARPKECGGAARIAGNRWDRAKAPGLVRYCDALAKGYARLKSAPEEALRFAETAERAMPAEAAPLVLSARAKTALGAYAEAFDRFQHAEHVSRAGLEAPGALHDFAVSAQRSGHPREALSAYRALAPRAELLDDAGEALRVFIEGASLAMSFGPDQLTEAVGYLTEARRMQKLPELDDYLVGALALALDRQKRQSEAAGIAAEAAGPYQLENERDASAKSGVRPLLPEGELDAMIAMLAERRDRDLAISRWQSYLDSPAGKGPFAAHARARRDALRHGAKVRK